MFLVFLLIFWMFVQYHPLKFGKFVLKIVGEIIFQSWPLLTLFSQLTHCAKDSQWKSSALQYWKDESIALMDLQLQMEPSLRQAKPAVTLAGCFQTFQYTAPNFTSK